MSHELATLVLAAFGGVLVVGSLVFFLRPRWLWQWLKGMVVFAVLALGLYSLAIAVSLLEYESLEGMDTVATVSTYRQGDQLWQVALQLPDEPPRYEMVRGDQWQLDARMMRFAGPIRWLGVAPGYRLERLSGRYTSLEQERTAPRSVIALHGNRWLDLWALDREYNLPFVEGVYGNATFMPMRDGASYDVRLSSSGLVAVPLNEAAREAVQHWNDG
ncbi:multidrug transporter [Marinobacter lutaoensis]|uniref:Multidrug transporter n=1 Tax=Marinobacter lutaoensis TaxID=135739 RepID=A0A1V2DTZ7_9GAMM|nr:multidrug transporter [Marinobacter lutaoensis]ONF44184.1 multidrug transporter [Marinobacter lutaoensis]